MNGPALVLYALACGLVMAACLSAGTWGHLAAAVALVTNTVVVVLAARRGVR